MRYTRWLALALLAVVVGALWLGAQTQKRPGTFYVYIISDDPWRVETGVNMAARARERGYEVVIHLTARGVKLASKKTPQDELANARKTLQQLIKEGVTVYVCPRNSARAGMKVPDDWIEGVVRGEPHVIDIQMAPNTEAVSF